MSLHQQATAKFYWAVLFSTDPVADRLVDTLNVRVHHRVSKRKRARPGTALHICNVETSGEDSKAMSDSELESEGPSSGSGVARQIQGQDGPGPRIPVEGHSLCSPQPSGGTDEVSSAVMRIPISPPQAHGWTTLRARNHDEGPVMSQICKAVPGTFTFTNVPRWRSHNQNWGG